MHRIPLILPALFFCLASTSVFAANDCTEPRTSWSLQVENDSIPGLDRSGTDHHYTNGMRLSWSYNTQADGMLSKLMDTALRQGDESWSKFCPRGGWRIGHQFYTPQNLSTPNLSRRDRPYAGFLYGSFTLSKAYATKRDPNRPMVRRSAEFLLGVVGPASGAGKLQRWWHDLSFVDGVPPRGWRHQLPNEPILNLNLNIARRFDLFKDNGRPFLDVTPEVDIGAGNLFTGLRLRGTVRIGPQLTGFPYQVISPTVYSSSTFAPKTRAIGVSEESRRFRWWFSASYEITAVAHDVFLDGTLFTSSHSVDAERLRTTVATGVHVEYGHTVGDISWVSKSKEFNTRDPRVDRHEYVSISIGRRF